MGVGYRPAGMSRDDANRRRKRRLRALAGVAALLIQLALPFLHSLEIAARHADAGLTGVASGPEHDERSCGVCTALGHANAVAAHAPQLASTREAARTVLVRIDHRPRVRSIASPMARAPPPSPSPLLS